MNTVKDMLTGAGLGFAITGLAAKMYENRTKKKTEFSKLMMPGLALAAPGLSELAIRALTEKSAASGFINTSGIDSRSLVKYAWDSTPVNEPVLSGIGNLLTNPILPVVGPIAGLGGTIAGLIDGEETQENVSAWKNLIPGVANYRAINRVKSQSKKQKREKGVEGHPMSELFGSGTAAISSGLLGALLGGGIGYLSKKNPEGVRLGALIGGGSGIGAAAIADLAAAIAAAIKRRRTADEQVEHDKGNLVTAKNLLVPGYARYNYYKRIGRSQGDRDEPAENKEKSK